MSKKKSIFRIASSLALLLTLAFMVACHGFFTDPILTSITITPASPSVAKTAPGNTVQMSATGVNDDGSIATLNTVTWASATPGNASISSSGLLTGLSVGTSVITATSGSVSGSTTATVTASALTGITITNGNAIVNHGSTVTFTANGTFADLTTAPLTNVSWTSSNTAVATIDPLSGLATPVSTATSGQMTTITAASGGFTASVILTIGF